jgi:hypothetical protein
LAPLKVERARKFYFPFPLGKEAGVRSFAVSKRPWLKGAAALSSYTNLSSQGGFIA